MTNSPAPGRLKVRREFLFVAEGRRWSETGLVLQVRQRAPDDTAPPRIGFTASKKVGNAVARNRARRRLRALAAEIIGPGGVPGHDYVVVARGAAVDRDFDALRADMTRALDRVHRPPRPRRTDGNEARS